MLRLDKTKMYKNVYGEELKPCSGSGMAMTGFTRDGRCINRDDDHGSHHVCVNIHMDSLKGGNFCNVTGQSDWCSQSMPCHEDQTKMCDAQNWCVCEWAFSSYINNAGGCDMIADVDCNATNMKVLEHYEDAASQSPDVANALQCLKQRCNLG